MKRILCLLIVAVFVCLNISISVTAEEAAEEHWSSLDSRYVSQEVIDRFFPESEGSYFKIYNQEDISKFVSDIPMDQWLTAPDNVWTGHGEPTYVNVLPDGTMKYEYIGMYDYPDNYDPHKDIVIWANSDWGALYPYIADSSLIFGDEVCVHILYCIDGDNNFNHDPASAGLFVYYVTDKGNFVLHEPPHANGKDVYVLPEEDFREYINDYYEYVDYFSENFVGVFGVHCCIEDCGFDLEPYRLENFSLEPKEPEGQEPLPGEPTEQETPTTDALNTQTPDAQPSTDENASTAWYVWALTALGGAVIGAGGAVAIGTAIRRKKKA